MPSTFFFVAATLLLSLNFVRPFGLAISDWLYFIALGLALVETAFTKQINEAFLKKNRLILPAGLVLFGALISTSRAQDVPTAIFEIVQQLYVITIFVSLVWIMVRRGYTGLIINVFIISGLFSALVALSDYFTGSNFGPILSGTPDSQFWYRYAGTLGHPNKFGYFLALTSILTFASLGSLRRRPVMDGVLSIALAIQLFAVYLSGSVTAYLGVFFGILFLIISSKMFWSKVLRIVLPVIIAGIPLIAIITILDIRSPIHRIRLDTDNIITLSLDRVQTNTADSRVAIYKQAWAQIEKSPIIGSGYDQTSTSGIASNSRLLDTTVHNSLLQIFYTGGLFAFVGWLIIYIYLSWESIKVLILKNGYPLTAGIAASLLAVLAMDQFQDAIYQREKWLVIGLLLGHTWSNSGIQNNHS